MFDAAQEIVIREISAIEEYAECTRLQKEVFGVPDLETSPVRHLVVTREAGGFTLGAFAGKKLVGFVLSVPAFGAGGEKYFYSHMTAVARDVQNLHIGARLKWAQRARAIEENIKFIKWTFQPVQARNAFFNLERLGVVVKSYAANFYGTDYSTVQEQTEKIGLDSDRIFAEWNLEDEKVVALSRGGNYAEGGAMVETIEIPNDWNALLKETAARAVAVQAEIKERFQTAFARRLICRRFERDERAPRYLLCEN